MLVWMPLAEPGTLLALVRAAAEVAEVSARGKSVVALTIKISLIVKLLLVSGSQMSADVSTFLDYATLFL